MKKAGLVFSGTLVVAGSIAVPSALGVKARTARLVGPKVTVQIKTPTRTLLRPTPARARSGWITKGGTPSGTCSANSAAGALTTATHGRWAGRYYSGIGIFITSILGVKPSGSGYWAIWVNGHFSDKGICDIRPRAGQRLLFQIKK